MVLFLRSFVLSLVDVDEHLMLEDGSLVWTSNDVVCVLQHQSEKIPLRQSRSGWRRMLTKLEILLVLLNQKSRNLTKRIANRQKPGCEKGSGVDRSRTATTVALKKKFKDRSTEFQNMHQEYREVVERRVFTATGTGEEVKPDFIVHYPTRYYPSPKYLIGLDFVGRHDVAGFFAEIVDNDRLVFWDLGELDVVCFHELWVGEELAPGFAHGLKPMD